ncbi:MAG TPA: hypothetical protein VFN37_00785 [Candidatus Baltobacteraceae bacterium]|nr:hypothetical protein [Candidatus Baltobacteraceae bacterium]
MKFARVFLFVFGSLICSACAEQPTGTYVDPAAVTVMPSPWPKPAIAAPNAPPRILALWMNETKIPSGSDWRGRVVTSTNVASVEIRTESFSFVAERPAFGVFQFRQHVLDMVPYYKRNYVVQVVARNTAGDQTIRLVPVEFR